MVLRGSLWITISLVTGLYLSSCSKPAQEETQQQKLTITGASTIAPLVSVLGKKFEEKHPGTRIDVHTGGSARGLADANQGLADIGMVSEALTEEEKKGLKVFLIGLDGVSIIVNKANPIKSMTSEQVKSIYTGKINNWKELGGPEAPITKIHKAEGRSTLKLFLNYFKLDNKFIKADTVIGDDQQGIKVVAGNPNAIGYVSIGSAEYEMSQGVPVKLLALDGVEATTANVANGKFPLMRELNLVVKNSPGKLTQQFVDFAQNKDNYEIITQEHFVPPTKH
ncbi:phosphate ABC transporter substrate-binding protein [Gloeothece verrucosa]|uniref:Extracellular solute-binding protein n=1 Tax=Gloeothece verrucosa (strain PCC 7822) TaxID=497965 RepID=E0UKZ2_GLOV7|nr:phosphate ABC transporter substrate-binding protein [Gloeothece verrucosa]ADN17622.1 extracellular solute-binding protein [Gloeothece verrucosa PCC 7822]